MVCFCYGEVVAMLVRVFGTTLGKESSLSQVILKTDVLMDYVLQFEHDVGIRNRTKMGSFRAV